MTITANIYISNRTVDFIKMCENGDLNKLKSTFTLGSLGSLSIREMCKGFLTACKYKQLKIADFIINDLVLDCRDILNAYIYRFICSEGNSKILKIFLDLKGDMGIDNNTRSYGFTVGCQQGHYEIIKILLNLRGCRKIDNLCVQKTYHSVWRWKRNPKIIRLLLSLDNDKCIPSHIIIKYTPKKYLLAWYLAKNWRAHVIKQKIKNKLFSSHNNLVDEIKYLPPIGYFPGGEIYHKSKKHFEMLVRQQ